MKRVSLTVLFVLYQIFVPFVLTRCGGEEDVPYDRTVDADEEDPEANENCDPNGIITADCVEEVTEGLGE